MYDGIEIALTRYARIVLLSPGAFETSSLDRTACLLSVNTFAIAEVTYQNTDCNLDLIGMIPLRSLSKGGPHGFCSAFIMFKAITEIMRNFRLGAMIKREGFKTRETDDFSMAHAPASLTSQRQGKRHFSSKDRSSPPCGRAYA